MTITQSALQRAGLDAVLEARRAGEDPARFRELLVKQDLLLLGALADRVREEEVGDAVRLTFSSDEAQPAAGVAPRITVRAADVPASERGLGVLRNVALTRLLSPKGARVAVDWAEIGIELAQVSLSFGANELKGPVLSKRGLPIAEDKTKKVKGEGMVALASLKKKELTELVRRAGRTPVFEDGSIAGAKSASAEGVTA